MLLKCKNDVELNSGICMGGGGVVCRRFGGLLQNLKHLYMSDDKTPPAGGEWKT